MRSGLSHLAMNMLATHWLAPPVEMVRAAKSIRLWCGASVDSRNCVCCVLEWPRWMTLLGQDVILTLATQR